MDHANPELVIKTLTKLNRLEWLSPAEWVDDNAAVIASGIELDPHIRP